MTTRLPALVAILSLPLLARTADPPDDPFRVPEKFAGDLGTYRTVLKFDDGTAVKTPADWQKRRAEIRKYWTEAMGEWPPLVDKPTAEVLAKERRGQVTQYHLRIPVAPDRTSDDAYLLVPEGKGPFPAVVVVFYDGKTGVGLGPKSDRDFAWRLANRGFVALSVGSDPKTFYPSKEKCRLQPLSFHAYFAANCRNLLAARPDVDPKRIGIVGHSYGGKWAMFAACLNDDFACGCWTDPGIVFDEARPNVNYWEPWYLGHEPGFERKRGIVNADNPRTGPYKKLIADGRDLHELQCLMAPRPFLVSGGAEDPPERWRALNHAVAVNKLLGFEGRVGMTNRPKHDPNEESNAAIDRFFERVLKP